MKVSIIVCVFNKGAFIKETLESITSQEYQNIEIILINDGSTDSTDIVCSKFSNYDKRILYFKQDNKGLIYARNLGLSLSTGDLIIPFDGDDIMPPKFVAYIVSAAQSNPNLDIFSPHFYIFSDSGSNFIRLPEIKIPEIFFENSIPSSSAFRKELLLKGYNYNTLMSEGYEDWDFWILLLKNGAKATRVESAVFYYRQLEFSRNKLAKTKHHRLHSIIISNHFDFFKKYRPNFIGIAFPSIYKFFNKKYRASKLYRKYYLRKIRTILA